MCEDCKAIKIKYYSLLLEVSLDFYEEMEEKYGSDSEVVKSLRAYLQEISKFIE